MQFDALGGLTVKQAVSERERAEAACLNGLATGAFEGVSLLFNLIHGTKAVLPRITWPVEVSLLGENKNLGRKKTPITGVGAPNGVFSHI